MKREVRETKFELLRTISMLFIIFYHAVVHSNTINQVVANHFIYSLFYSGGKFGVALFIMIAGYFLIDKKFNYKKLIKLELQVLFYSITLYFGLSLIGNYTFKINELIDAFLPNITKTYWFYSGYFLIALLSPYLSKVLNNITKKEYLNLLIILFIFLIALSNLRFEFINEIVVLFYYYIIGGFIKKYGKDYKRFNKFFLIIFIMCYLVMSLSILILNKAPLPSDIYIYYYTSLGSILLFLSVCSFFLWFSYRNINYSKFINCLGSISFAIYLFHDHFISRKFLWNNLFKITNPNNIFLTTIIIIIAIIFIYVITYLLETLRKFLFGSIAKKIKLTNITNNLTTKLKILKKDKTKLRGEVNV